MGHSFRLPNSYSSGTKKLDLNRPNGFFADHDNAVVMEQSLVKITVNYNALMLQVYRVTSVVAHACKGIQNLVSLCAK